jgi:hypothetical protein
MTLKFSREKYFNGQQNTRNIEDNWKMIKTFMQQAVEKHVPSMICKGKKITTMDNTINQKNDSKT